MSQSEIDKLVGNVIILGRFYNEKQRTRNNAENKPRR